MASVGSDNPAIRKRAEKIYDELRTVYQPRHTVRKSSLNEFPKLDATFYEETLRFLKSNGFKHIADIEDTTISMVYPNTRTMIRTFCSDDGASVAACYHVRISGFMALLAFFLRIPRHHRTIEFETEFDNGMFVLTTNAEQDQLDAEPGLVRTKLPHDSPAETILQTHRDGIAQFQAADPDAAPVRCTSYDGLIAMQDRLQELKSRHRQAIGYVTEEEMVRMAGSGGASAGRAVYQAIQKLHGNSQE